MMDTSNSTAFWSASIQLEKISTIAQTPPGAGVHGEGTEVLCSLVTYSKQFGRESVNAGHQIHDASHFHELAECRSITRRCQARPLLDVESLQRPGYQSGDKWVGYPI